MGRFRVLSSEFRVGWKMIGFMGVMAIQTWRRRHAIPPTWFIGFFDGNIGRQGGFLIGAKRQLCPTKWRGGGAARFAPLRGDDGNDRSFITRDQRDAGPMAPGRSV